MSDSHYPSLDQEQSTIRLTCQYRVGADDEVSRSAQVCGFEHKKSNQGPAHPQLIMSWDPRLGLIQEPSQPFDRSVVNYANDKLSPLIRAFFELAPRLVRLGGSPHSAAFFPLEISYEAELIVGGPGGREWPITVMFNIGEAGPPRRLIARIVHVMGEFNTGIWQNAGARRLNNRRSLIEDFADSPGWQQERQAFAARYRKAIVAFIDLTPHGHDGSLPLSRRDRT